MQELRECFTQNGYDAVSTYIQSGNVFFKTNPQNRQILEATLEKQLAETFPYKPNVFIRNLTDIQTLVASFPEFFSDPDWKHNVMFLNQALDYDGVTSLFSLHPTFEKVVYVPGALFWSVSKAATEKTCLDTLNAKKESKLMTVRNKATTLKLLELITLTST